jgi:hypothetical protein
MPDWPCLGCENEAVGAENELCPSCVYELLADPGENSSPVRARELRDRGGMRDRTEVTWSLSRDSLSQTTVRQSRSTAVTWVHYIA